MYICTIHTIYVLFDNVSYYYETSDLQCPQCLRIGCAMFMQVARKLCMAEILNISKFSFRIGVQPCTVYTHFTTVYVEFTHWHATVRANVGKKPERIPWG